MDTPLPDWPDYGLADDQRPALRQALAAGRPAALATIAALGDGGPRPVGTQMVFAEGLVSGFLSGGCVEGDVAGHARNCLADGRPRLSGMDTFAHMRKGQAPNVPVVICSGYLVDLEGFQEETGSTPNGFLQKPYAIDDMARTVRRILDEVTSAKAH